MSRSVQIDETRTWLRPYTKLLVAATVVLIFLGGQVKSHDAGLSVPDWPTSYEYNMFTFPYSLWVGGIFHEHLHRLVATFVGILTIGLVIGLVLKDKRDWVRVLGFASLVGVILQGVLGGITVLLLLPTWVSVSHALMAQGFLMLVVIVAYTQSAELHRRTSRGVAEAPNSLTKPARWLVAVVFGQLILGALMRHTEAGLAIPDFPRMGGQLIPWFDADTVAWINEWRGSHGFVNNQPLEVVTLGQVLIHFAHRVGALVVVAATLACLVRGYGERGELGGVWRILCGTAVVVAVQATLGIVTVLTMKTALITSLHVAMGAVLLALATLLALRAYPVPAQASEVRRGESDARAVEA